MEVLRVLVRSCTAAIGDLRGCDAVFLFTTETLSALSPDGVFEGFGEMLYCYDWRFTRL
jgi:hypothetical protein